MDKKFFYRVFLTSSFLAGWFPSLWAHSLSSDSLTVWLDYACYKFSPALETAATVAPQLTYVEIYYALDRSQLSVPLADTEKIAMLELSMKIADHDQKEAAAQNWKVGCKVMPEDTARSTYLFYDLQALQLLAGEYSLDFAVTQPSSHKLGRKKINLKVSDFSENKLKLSDIQLALSADPDTSQSKFVKAGRMILPNATKIYGATSPVLYFYAEAYHLVIGAGDRSEER